MKKEVNIWRIINSVVCTNGITGENYARCVRG